VAVIRTVLKIPLPDKEHELHVVREDRDPFILLPITKPGAKWVKSRSTVRLPARDAMRLGKFLCGISEIDGVKTERVERETTLPGPELETDTTDDG
jgi:hypothetical protein